MKNENLETQTLKLPFKKWELSPKAKSGLTLLENENIIDEYFYINGELRIRLKVVGRGMNEKEEKVVN